MCLLVTVLQHKTILRDLFVDYKIIFTKNILHNVCQSIDKNPSLSYFNLVSYYERDFNTEALSSISIFF